MATETNFIIISLKNLERMMKNMYKTFAQKSIEDKAINAVVSKEQPADQSVGDLWLIETERN